MKITGCGLLLFLSFSITKGLDFPSVFAAPSPLLAAPLGEVLNKNLDGISMENKPQAELDEELSALKKALRSSNHRNLFAEIQNLAKSLGKKEKQTYRKISVPKNPDNNFWAKLTDLTDYEIFRSLRKVKSEKTLQWLSQKATSDTAWCKTPGGIHFWLANKFEEDFPKADAIEKSLMHYEKSIQCSSDPATKEKSRFRYSMISIWQEKCEQAIPQLQALVADQSRSFSSRAHYWLDECKAANNADKLIEQWPFSFHSLLVAKRKGVSADKFMKDNDPTVKFRSGDLTIDTEVRKTELLLRLGERMRAATLLQSLVKTTKTKDPEFRIYMAVLKSRVEDFQQTFAIISEVLSAKQEFFGSSVLQLLLPEPFRDTILKYCDTLDPLLVTALMRQESSFNSNAKSRVGARGLMQIMPATARTMAKVNKQQLLNPDTNIRLGVRYFKMLLNRFDNKVELALAAYNAGSLNVENWMRRFPGTNVRLFVDLIPYTETRDYVAVIVRNYYWYRWMNQNAVAAGRLPANTPNIMGVQCTIDDKEDFKI